MRGLDPRIHGEALYHKQYCSFPLKIIMDCRVKPGNDRSDDERILTSQLSL
jgi:hypothetical protein